MSTGGSVRGSTPAEYCTTQQCNPNERSANEKFGPVQLDGSLSLGNIGAIAEWAEKIDQELHAAVNRINEKIDALVCGPACDKKVANTLTLRAALNPAGMDTSDKDCQKAFSTTLEASGGGVRCDLAYLMAMTSINGAIENAGLICQQFHSKCGAESVEISKSSSDETTPIDVKEDNGTFWCSVKITAEVMVRCAKGETAINSPSISGALDATMKCLQPNQCAAGQKLPD